MKKQHREGRGQKTVKVETPPISPQHEALLDWLERVTFRRTLTGGLCERDVWKKIEELNALYEAALLAERARCDTFLASYKTRSDARLAEYKRLLAQATCDPVAGDEPGLAERKKRKP